MSAILVKTSRAKRTFTDAAGKKHEITDAMPFRTDAATAGGLLEAGGFRLARDQGRAPRAVDTGDSGNGAASGDESGQVEPGTEDEPEATGDSAAVAPPDDEG